jgi:hypothetical protein
LVQQHHGLHGHEQSWFNKLVQQSHLQNRAPNLAHDNTKHSDDQLTDEYAKILRAVTAACAVAIVFIGIAAMFLGALEGQQQRAAPRKKRKQIVVKDTAKLNPQAQEYDDEESALLAPSRGDWAADPTVRPPPGIDQATTPLPDAPPDLADLIPASYQPGWWEGGDANEENGAY